MTVTDEDLLAIIDEVTVALGEILLSHRQLTEGFFEDQQIDRSQDRIEKRRTEIEKERNRIRKIRDAVRHRREVERLRKQHDQGKSPQTETVKKPTGIKSIINHRGTVIGYRQTNGCQTVFLNPKGNVVAREVAGRTYDHRGSLVGNGKQGLRLLGQK